MTIHQRLIEIAVRRDQLSWLESRRPLDRAERRELITLVNENNKLVIKSYGVGFDAEVRCCAKP